jgi:hypothetical protein
MTLQEWKDGAAIFQAVATGVSLLVAAAWIFYRYVRNAENRSNVGLTCEIVVLGAQGNQQVVQITAKVENRGKIPYHIHALELSLRGLALDGDVKHEESSRRQLDFGALFYEGSFIGKGWYTIVDPGIVGQYHQVVAVPSSLSFLYAFVALSAPGSGLDSFNAERTILLTQSSGAIDGCSDGVRQSDG